MGDKPNIMTMEQAEAVLTGLLKIGCARRNKTAELGILDNLISPPTVRAGETGPQVTNPLWGAAQTGLIGAGVGGAVGAGRALMDKDRKKRLLQEALQGAVLGGGIGGGLGLGWHGLNYAAKHQGPEKPRASSRFQEAREAYQDGGIPALTGTLSNQISRAVGASDQDPSSTNTGATVGAGTLGTLGFMGGSMLDRQRSLTEQQRPVTEAASNHARDTAAHKQTLASPPNLRQNMHDLAMSGGTDDARLRNMLHEPVSPTNPQRRIDVLRGATTPHITGAELGLDPVSFETIRQRAVSRAHPTPVATPGQALPTAPWSLRGRVGGTLGGGILGALLGSQGLPRLFGDATPNNVGYGR